MGQCNCQVLTVLQHPVANALRFCWTCTAWETRSSLGMDQSTAAMMLGCQDVSAWFSISVRLQILLSTEQGCYPPAVTAFGERMHYRTEYAGGTAGYQ